jgi:hypothetical protein
MQARLLVIVSLLAAAGLFLGVLGCNKSGKNASSAKDTPPPENLPSLPQQVILDKTDHPVSWGDSRLPEGLSEIEKSQIRQLVGRIPNITHEVLSVSACWDDIPVAVRLRVPEGFVFLVKGDQGVWVLSAVLRVRSAEKGPE